MTHGVRQREDGRHYRESFPEKAEHFRSLWGYSIICTSSLPWGCLGDFATPCKQETTGNAEESAPEMQRFTFYSIALHQQFSTEIQSLHVLEAWLVQTMLIL